MWIFRWKGFGVFSTEALFFHVDNNDQFNAWRPANRELCAAFKYLIILTAGYPKAMR